VPSAYSWRVRPKYLKLRKNERVSPTAASKWFAAREAAIAYS
jgi:hypothetical protein